jgi:hypothetical protein
MLMSFYSAFFRGPGLPIDTVRITSVTQFTGTAWAELPT